MRIVASFVLLCAVLALAAAPAAADDAIVRYRDGATAAQRLAALASAGAVPRGGLIDGTFQRVSAPGPALLTRLLAQPAVLYAEPDRVVRAHALPNDALLGRQWSLPMVGAPAAWDVTTGAPSVVVAVVDSGLDLAHPDLAPNLWRNAGEVPGNGVDDDRNGLVDDVRGYDFHEGDAVPQDADGHGSHVAGVIGAAGNDGGGVTGVAWRAALLPLRALGSGGVGRLSDALSAYAYAVAAGARVVNVSWGGLEATRAERELMAAHPEVLFVTSSGNDAADVERRPMYPCSFDLPNVICVGASGRADEWAAFSNWGARSVDLAAPGVAITSTVPGGWVDHDGTSMAAPHVAGAAALLLARSPGLSGPQLRSALVASATPLPGMRALTVSGGRLDVARALGVAAAGVPSVAEQSVDGPDVAAPLVQIVGLSRRGGVLRARVRCSEGCRISVRVVARRGSRRVTVVRRGASRGRAGIAVVRLPLRRKPAGALSVEAEAMDRAGNVADTVRRLRL